MTEGLSPAEPPKRHIGGKWPKGVSGNPGGKRRERVIAAPPIQPVDAQPANAERNRLGRFTAGNAGKPKGTRHRATILAEALFDGQAEALVQKAIEMALSGDPTAMRLALDRLCPPRRSRPITVAMPPITTAHSLIAASAALAEAATSGEITPDEAAALSTLVGNVAKAVETAELAERLAKLEEQIANGGKATSS